MAVIPETETRNWGLRAKFITGVAAGTFLIALLIVLLQQFFMRQAISERIAEQGVAIADTIVSTSDYYVIFGLTDDLQSIARDLSANRSIEYADFVAADGSILAATDAAKRPELFRNAPKTKTATAWDSDLSGEALHLYVRPFFEGPQEEGSEPRGWFRLALNESAAREAGTRLAFLSLLIILGAIAASIVLANWGARVMIRPILDLVETATLISRGDLTRRTEARSNDELGLLSNGFNQMVVNLEKTIGKVMNAQGKLTSVGESVGSRAKTVIDRADDQRATLEDAYNAIDQLNGGIRKISGNVEALSAASEETSSSILEMVASMEEVSRHTDSLFDSVEETASATNEMVSSINEVDRSVEYLQSFVTDTSSSMMQMSASIVEVERNAAQSYDLALAVANAAESGMNSVRETIEGMEQIRRAVHEANQVVSKLGDRSAEIGKILSVIEDIAEQTNLLALNAAILAAQAGEHGKGFSVVAAEIRDLSERTASSTKEIATLIKDVRTEVSSALDVMSDGSRMVESGVELSHEAGRALTNILDSAVRASEMGKEIAGATREQAQGSEAVSKAIERVQEMVEQISSATSQQSTGSTHILQAVESMRDATRYVRQATTEQKSGSQMISSAAERMIDMVHEIFEVTSGQASDSEKIVQTMEQVRHISELNRKSAHEMSAAVEQLNDAMRMLQEEVRQFRVRS